LGAFTANTGTDEEAAQRKGSRKAGQYTMERVFSQDSRRPGGQRSLGEATAPTFMLNSFGGSLTISNTTQKATGNRRNQTTRASWLNKTQNENNNTIDSLDDSTSADGFVLDALLAMNRRPYEPSVIPGAYRSKQPIPQEDGVDLAAVLEDSRLHLAEEEERIRQLKYRKRVGHEKAQLSFVELREGLLRLRQQRDWKLWKEALAFKKGLDRQLAEFQLNQRKVTVSRKRDV
jgi:hypothetical protein